MNLAFLLFSYKYSKGGFSASKHEKTTKGS